MIAKRYLPDGSTRAIWVDSQANRERRQGVVPFRASRIEVIPTGTLAGRFHVDFTPLAEETQDNTYRCCLLPTFLLYGDANRAEVAWLEANFILAETTHATRPQTP